MERADQCASEVTETERSLFMVCEFWAAVEARALGAHWRSGVDESLCTLITICAAIGLSEVAEALTEIERDFNGPLTPAQRRDRVKTLEGRLLGLKTPVDQVIGRFARSIAPMLRVRARRSHDESIPG
jgi:hypothetical protein